VILDNLRAADTRADRYDPIFQRTFDEYAAYRGFTIDSAIVRHPTAIAHQKQKPEYWADRA